MRRIAAMLLILIAGAACRSQSSPAQNSAPAEEREIDHVMERLLSPPVIHAEPGFTATVLVPPGQMYDPLTMIQHGDAVWVTDDGGNGHYGRIWKVDTHGHVSTGIPPEELTPTIGFDFAPPGFGDYAGKILTFSAPGFYSEGPRRPHVVEVHDPDRKMPKKKLCDLPNAGTVGEGIGGAGLEARFGPPGSAFANRFFTVAIMNNTIYQTTADGLCKPFVTFDEQVWGIAFLPDGSRMLATLKGGGPIFGGKRDAPDANVGRIVTVRPDGVIDPKPVIVAHRPTDVEVAPANFHAYGGQIFFTDWETDSSAPPDEPLPQECKLYRIASDGTAHLVASGFLRPAGISFIDGSIWILNINRDRGDLPDGSIIKIDVQ